MDTFATCNASFWVKFTTGNVMCIGHISEKIVSSTAVTVSSGIMNISKHYSSFLNKFPMLEVEQLSGVSATVDIVA